MSNHSALLTTHRDTIPAGLRPTTTATTTALASRRSRAFYTPLDAVIMAQPRVLAVIPSRYGSSRLPGKPLLPMLGGAPMIAHVVRAARAAKSTAHVIVATDHEGIAAAAEAAGAEAVLTSRALRSGTDRVAAALRVAGAEADVVVNVQGDEPLIDPGAIDLAARLLLAQPTADMATLSAPLPLSALLDPHTVKVVCSHPVLSVAPPASDALPLQGLQNAKMAFAFSRAPIGVDRSTLEHLLQAHSGSIGAPSAPLHVSHACRLHVGLYAFRPAALQRFISLPPAPLELLEQLEQLRALQDGMRIVVGEVDTAARGIDTMQDHRLLTLAPPTGLHSQ